MEAMGELGYNRLIENVSIFLFGARRIDDFHFTLSARCAGRWYRRISESWALAAAGVQGQDEAHTPCG